MPNYYELLGVGRTATTAEVRQAYLRLAPVALQGPAGCVPVVRVVRVPAALAVPAAVLGSVARVLVSVVLAPAEALAVAAPVAPAVGSLALVPVVARAVLAVALVVRALVLVVLAAVPTRNVVSRARRVVGGAATARS